MTNYKITASRAPNWDDDEVKRRLGRAYMLILTYQAEREAADRGEFGDLTRPAAGDAPAVKPEAQDEL